jgi:hypothetical protein
MIDSPTKYNNPTRTIAGSTNFVFQTDVVLLCNTSSGAVNLNLLEIPQGNFNTQYKLYVVDASNNASINNITITAPTGFTVNNSPTAVINVNNGVAVVTMTSNTTYNALYNFTANSGFIVVSYAALINLINNNSLLPSQQYLVTDAIFINSSSPQKTVPIIITAISTNEVSLLGSGIFLNADYQGVGNYTSQITFVSQTGVYQSIGVYVIGDCVVYNNLNYINISGANTGDPASAPADWSALALTSTNGYITEIDIIKYNVATNQITYREDVRNNRIENNLNTYLSVTLEAFASFQWGNNSVLGNTILGESVIDIINQSGRIKNNNVENESFILGGSGNNGRIDNNRIILQSQLRIVASNNNAIGRNFLSNNSLLRVNINNASVSANVLNESSLTCAENNGKLDSNDLQLGSVCAIDIITLNGFVTFNTITASRVGFTLGAIVTNFEGNFNNNFIENSTLSFEDGFQITGLFSENTVKNSFFTVRNQLLGNVVHNEFNTTNWTFNNHVNVLSSIKLNYLKDAIVTTDVIDSFSANNLVSVEWTVTNNVSTNFDYNQWLDVIFSTITMSRFITYTNITSASFTCANFGQIVNGGIIQNGIGTTVYILDMNDLAIYSSVTRTLTIPTCLNTFFGIYQLVNSSGKIIDNIINLSERFPTRFLNGDITTIVTFRVLNTTALTLANGIVSSDSTPYPISYQLHNNFGVQDFVEIRRSFGLKNAIEEYERYL